MDPPYSKSSCLLALAVLRKEGRVRGHDILGPPLAPLMHRNKHIKDRKPNFKDITAGKLHISTA